MNRREFVALVGVGGAMACAPPERNSAAAGLNPPIAGGLA